MYVNALNLCLKNALGTEHELIDGLFQNLMAPPHAFFFLKNLGIPRLQIASGKNWENRNEL